MPSRQQRPACGKKYQKGTYAPYGQPYTVIGCMRDERGCIRAKIARASDVVGQGVPDGGCSAEGVPPW